MWCGLPALARAVQRLSCLEYHHRVRIAATAAAGGENGVTGYAGNAGASKVQKLSEISLEALPRFSTGLKSLTACSAVAWCRAAVLIGGDPGAGKSALLRAGAVSTVGKHKRCVTGEESLQQVAMRAHRLGLPTANLNMLSGASTLNKSAR